jgi:hypothetical protein
MSRFVSDFGVGGVMGWWSYRCTNCLKLFIQVKLRLMYVSLNGLKDSERDVTVLKMSQVIVSYELPKILNNCRSI